MIFKYLLSVNDKSGSVLKDYLPKIAIAAIVVNASWFIMGILIDISTLLIAGIGSLPSQILNKDYSAEKLAIPTEISLVSTNSEKKEKFSLESIRFNIKNDSQKAIGLSDLLKYENNISGPLIFL